MRGEKDNSLLSQQMAVHLTILSKLNFLGLVEQSTIHPKVLDTVECKGLHIQKEKKTTSSNKTCHVLDFVQTFFQ